MCFVMFLECNFITPPAIVQTDMLKCGAVFGNKLPVPGIVNCIEKKKVGTKGGRSHKLAC